MLANLDIFHFFFNCFADYFSLFIDSVLSYSVWLSDPRSSTVIDSLNLISFLLKFLEVLGRIVRNYEQVLSLSCKLIPLKFFIFNVFFI